jgi:hypothetical protein
VCGPLSNAKCTGPQKPGAAPGIPTAPTTYVYEITSYCKVDNHPNGLSRTVTGVSSVSCSDARDDYNRKTARDVCEWPPGRAEHDIGWSVASAEPSTREGNCGTRQQN